MKLIIQNERVVATATDAYAGPEVFIDAPVDFDLARMGEYRYVNGALVIAPDTRLTRLAFRNRFTTAEKATLEMAALDDPMAPMAQRQTAAMLRAYLADLAVADFVDTADPSTQAGVRALAQAGILAAGRDAEILAP